MGESLFWCSIVLVLLDECQEYLTMTKFETFLLQR